MPKTLRLSTLQREVYEAMKKGNVGEEFTVQQLAEKAKFSEIEVKSILIVLMARNLIERRNFEGRALYRLR